MGWVDTLANRRKSLTELRRWSEKKLDSTAIAWDATGKLLAIGYRNGNIEIREVETNKILKNFDSHTRRIMSLSWSCQTKALASASKDGFLRIFDTLTPPVLRPFSGHRDRVRCVAFSPTENQKLASCGWDGTVRIWESITGKEIVNVPIPARVLEKIAWHPQQSEIIAVSAIDKEVEIFDCKEKQKLNQKIIQHAKEIRAIAWRPQGDWLATAGEDCQILLWDAKSWQKIPMESMTHDDKMNSIHWNLPGDRLASAGNDGYIKIWGLDGKLIKKIGNLSMLQLVVWNPKMAYANYLAFTSFIQGEERSRVDVNIVDIADDKSDCTQIASGNLADSSIRCIVWDPQGLYVACGQLNAIHIYSASGLGKKSKKIQFPLPITGLDWREHDDGSLIAVASHCYLACYQMHWKSKKSEWINISLKWLVTCGAVLNVSLAKLTGAELDPKNEKLLSQRGIWRDKRRDSLSSDDSLSSRLSSP